MTTTDLVRALDDALGVGSLQADTLDALEAAEVAGLLDAADAMMALGPAPGTHPEFRRSLATRLAEAPAPSSLATVQRPWWARLWRRTAYAGALGSAVVAFATVGAVSASANALPGQVLYPVKRTVEWARMALVGDGEIRYHLELASLRLSEAVAVPGAAGQLLAEFSQQVTAGLAAADAAIDAGATREELAPPLLGWLLTARADLVSNRAIMPPLAWRSALALVDEAISALQTGDPLTLRPVPRLEDAMVALGKWSPPPFWLRPVGGWLDALRGSGAGGSGGTVASGGAAEPGGEADVRGPLVIVVPRPAEPAPEAPIASGPPPSAPPSAAQPGDRGSAGDPDPTATVVVQVPPTGVPPTATRVDPTPTASATAVPANQPPVIEVAWCSPNPVMVFGISNCAIRVVDEAAADTLRFAWTADLGQMLSASTANPTYYADFDHGVKETATWITVRVTDVEGAEAEHRFLMKVNSLPQGGNAAAARVAPGP